MFDLVKTLCSCFSLASVQVCLPSMHVFLPCMDDPYMASYNIVDHNMAIVDHNMASYNIVDHNMAIVDHNMAIVD